MNKPYSLILGITALILTGAGCLSSKPLPTTEAPSAPSAIVNDVPTQIPSPQPMDSNATVVDNDTGSEVKFPMVYPIEKNPVKPRLEGEICDPGNFICTSSALVFQEFSKTFSVTGTAIAFESTVNWRIEDAGKELLKGYAMTDAPDVGKPGVFKVDVKDLNTSAAKLDLVIYEASAKDGSDTHVLRIPIRIKP